MKYRPEIDGLRAVAVLPVIFFHSGFNFFSGGYVGVDVFFVISGYLITTIIIREMEIGKFTIANFYERRVRRILPALTVVLLACLPFAYFWMIPKQLVEFSESLIAVSLFSSNIFFWLKTGYFETANELKPLLHTWSLAVEEQYYLFFPIFIILAWRLRKHYLVTLLALMGFLSILLAQGRSLNHPNSTFYLIPTRLWEILIGSFVAFYILNQKKTKSNGSALTPIINQILSILGFFLILYAILVFDENTPFPSFYALVPTLGTALIILFTTNKTVVGKFLGNKILVGIGLISYSAYLWHQPIFAFARIRSLSELSSVVMFALGVLSLVLAYLTWKYVETPFRDKSKFNRRIIFQFAAISLIIIPIIGFVGIQNEGFGNRISANGRRYDELDSITRPNYGLNKDCDNKSLTILEQCKNSNYPEILVWGDSYAMHLVPGIIASNPDAKIIQITRNSCAPIVGIVKIDLKNTRPVAEYCMEFNNGVIKWLKNNSSVRYVVLGSPFSLFYGENTVLINNKIISADKRIAQSHFKATLAMLSEMGIKPVVFAPPPSDGSDIGNCLMISGDAIDCRIETSTYNKVQKGVLEILREVENTYPVIWISDVLCDNTHCNTEIDGIFIYGDKGHLSIEGSEYLGKKMNFYNLITSKDD